MMAMAVSRCFKCTSLSSMWTTEPEFGHPIPGNGGERGGRHYIIDFSTCKYTCSCCIKHDVIDIYTEVNKCLLCLSLRDQHPLAATARQFCCDLPKQPYAAQSYHPEQVAEGQVEGMITISGQHVQILC